MRVKELMDIFNSYENVEIRDLLINGFKTSSPNEKRCALNLPSYWEDCEYVR